MHAGGYSDPFGGPFADPFFGGGQDPFAAMMQRQERMMSNMNQMMSGMLGGFGGFGGFGAMMDHPMLMNDMPSHSAEPSSRRSSRASSGPIVEEPDSEPPSAALSHRGSSSFGGPSSFSSTSFSSSSFSSGGSSGPVYFQSSTSMVKGPNGCNPLKSLALLAATEPTNCASGIVERTHSVRDSRTGIERTAMQVQRLQRACLCIHESFDVLCVVMVFNCVRCFLLCAFYHTIA